MFYFIKISNNSVLWTKFWIFKIFKKSPPPGTPGRGPILAKLCISITFERLISEPCVTTDKKGLWKGYLMRGRPTFYDKWFKSCRYSKISQIFAKNRDFSRFFRVFSRFFAIFSRFFYFFLPFTRFSYFWQNFSPIGAFFRKLEGGVIFDPPPDKTGSKIIPDKIGLKENKYTEDVGWE